MSEATWWTLIELVQKPELLLPPATIIPRLAYEGRVTLLAAHEKFGKSTLVRQGVAAFLLGQDFLGERVQAGRVAWLCLDEPIGDLVRGLYELGARDNMLITDRRPGFGELQTTITREDIQILVIDTLTELAGGIVADANSASEYQPLLAALRGIARRTGCAVVLLHHLNKAGTGYADSRQIGAGVDIIIEMRQGDDSPTRRAFKVRGRGVFSDFTLDWTRDTGYAVSHGELSLDARILATVEAQPGISMKGLRAAVSGANADKDAALLGLMHRGAIIDGGDGSAHRYFTPGTIKVSARQRQGSGNGEAGACKSL